MGADASVEVPKLHNIKLLIASFYTHIDYNYHLLHAQSIITGKLKEWVMIDAKSSSLKLSQQSLAALFSLLQVPIASVLVQS